MIKTVLSSLFAVFLFALGAAGSWYFIEYQKSLPEEVSEEAAIIDELTTTPVATEASEEEEDTATNDLPIAVHSRAMSPEEVFRIGALHRQNIDAMKKREERLKSEEMRLKLVQDDIEAYKQEVEGILKQVQSGVETSEQLLDQVIQQRQALTKEQQAHQAELKEIREATTVPDATEEANVKELSELLGGIAEDKAAEMLKELMQRGDMTLALKLLSTMEQRDAAKVLDSIDDPVLLADITERFRELPKPPPKKKKR